MIKELLIFILILILLSFGMHYEEWLDYPLEHLKKLPYSSAYGLGYWHPLVFTLIVYIIVSVPRFIYKLLIKKN